MSKDTKPTTRKQKVLITLIIVTGLLLVISLVFGGSVGSDQPAVDRETCLQRGDVWGSTSKRCYSSTARSFPQSYVAICNPATNETADFTLLAADTAQLILPDTPRTLRRLQRIPGSNPMRFRDPASSLMVTQSGGQISIRRGDSIVYENCQLAEKGPTPPAGTAAAAVGINETARAGGVDITLNEVVEEAFELGR